MKKIIYTRPDGGLTVIHPVINTSPVRENITEDEALQRAWEKDIPADAINPQIVDESTIPTDRTFRNAWKHEGAAVMVDMPKAVEIQKDRLRELRAPLLADLDIQFMRAVEAGDSKTQRDITAKKSALRDVTDDPALTEATTPDELKAVIPDALSATLDAQLAKE